MDQDLIGMLSLLTQNCFGVPAPSTHHRLLSLAQSVNAAEYSIVCLQEVQAHQYRRLLEKACVRYPHRAYQSFVHAPKGGLVTLARNPMDDCTFALYRERGLWYTPAMADWVLHKGILQTRLMIEGVQVVVLNTHLTANYSGDWGRDNLYARNEWQQLAQLAEAVRAQPADALVLVAGDFNIPRGTWLYHDFIDASGLTDPMANDDTPTYRPFSRLMEKRYSHAIDYTLYRAPMPVTAVARQVHTGKTRLVNGREGYISDHNGIELTLTW